MMLQYLLTGLAGIVLGIVGMRIWSAERARSDGDAQPADGNGAAPAGALSTRNLLIGAGVLVVAAVVVFLVRSPDDGASVEVPAMAPGLAGDQNLDDVDTMIGRLAKRLEDNPDDGEGFRMLGWSYVMTGKPKEAIAPYKRALELMPDNASVHAGYGEALVAIAGDKVTPDAKAAFEKALALDRAHPRARYFLALWKAQNGQEKAALDAWIALANSGPVDAPWQQDVRRQIDKVSKQAGIDVTGRLQQAASVPSAVEPPPLDPSAVQAASQLSDEERQSMISGMVEGLAQKLKANPNDAEGWARLIRSRMVLKQAKQAGQDLVTARKALAGDAVGLTTVDTVAREAGVPGA